MNKSRTGQKPYRYWLTHARPLKGAWLVYLMGEGLKLPMLNGMGRTDRIDNWWAQPAVMGIGLILAVLWTLWRVVFFSDHIDYNVNGAHVISPMFSPNVLDWDMFSWMGPSFLGKCRRY